MNIKSEHLSILMAQAVALGLPVDGLTANGEFTWSIPSTPEQLAQAQAIIAAYDEAAEDAAIAAAEAARLTALAELQVAKVVMALAQIATDQGNADLDLAAISTATTAQVRDAIGRVISRQKRGLMRETVIIKVLAQLVKNAI